ncbi:PSMD1 protein [Cryptosporidium ryanae]|uniref:PSMD1 protein n=1 Tax=Cryptosporidium ryanae TaxID=515981 RepID=UPI00351A5739|nr:PSMD1 protein [Cryptosporidium ryanae]
MTDYMVDKSLKQIQVGDDGNSRTLSSVSGFALLLEDESVKLREYALKELNEVVDGYWFEMAEYLNLIENCFEDEMFPGRELAALLASKVYFHMEDYDEALKYLLHSYKLFDPMENSSYSESMVVKCIDEFIRICKNDYSDKIASGENYSGLDNRKMDGLDDRLSNLVEDLLIRSTSNNNYLNAMGITIESRRSDLLLQILKNIKSVDLLILLFTQCLNSVKNLDSNKFKYECYQIIIDIIEKTGNFKTNQLLQIYCQCLCYTGNKDKLSDILLNLVKEDETVTLSYYIGFFLRDNEINALSLNIINDINEEITKIEKSVLENQNSGTEESDMKDGSNNTDSNNELLANKTKYLNNLKYILLGEASIDLYLQFLHLNNQPDLGILDYVKNNNDQRSTIIHTALVMAHGLMQSGTTCDLFLRNNLEWLGKATHWSRFSTAASLGVIHMGHIRESFKVLSTCLPAHRSGSSSENVNNSGGGNALGGQYSEGGSFYALGLIHANHVDEHTKMYLLEQLRNPQKNEVLQHGACLGLGIMYMGTSNNDLYEELKNILYMDNAVAGEAAAYAIGMLMFGSGSTRVVNNLISYAKDTQHEKIIRACSVALGLVMYGKQEEVNELFAQLNSDNEHFIRFGAINLLGLAYCGTGNDFALEKLLFSCVNELSDDNKRAAVFSLGLVMCRNIQQVPQIFNLLCDNYNPHVRYAAALTLGIICCGTGLSKVISNLDTLTNDSVDFVRQAAYIGLGMLIMQQNEQQCDKLVSIKQKLIKASTDKHEHITTRFGAILGIGLADAGGRNVVASLFSRTGEIRPKAVIGFTLFYQFWYWFPLVHCISLSFYPTCSIGVDKDLRIPKSFKMKCKGNSGKYNYPKPFSLTKNEDRKVVVTAVLSTASKKKSKKPVLASKKEDQKMEVNKRTSTTEKNNKSQPEETGNKSNSEDNENDKAEFSSSVSGDDEKNEYLLLNNPFRVIGDQSEFLEFIQESRFTPAVDYQHKAGFIILNDNKPSEEEEYILVHNNSKKSSEQSDKDNKKDEDKSDTKTEDNNSSNNGKTNDDSNDGNEQEVISPETFEWQG